MKVVPLPLCGVTFTTMWWGCYHIEVESLPLCGVTFTSLNTMVNFQRLLQCSDSLLWGRSHIDGCSKVLRRALGFLSPLRSESATLRDVERPLSERSGERKGRKGTIVLHPA